MAKMIKNGVLRTCSRVLWIWSMAIIWLTGLLGAADLQKRARGAFGQAKYGVFMPSPEQKMLAAARAKLEQTDPEVGQWKKDYDSRISDIERRLSAALADYNESTDRTEALLEKKISAMPGGTDLRSKRRDIGMKLQVALTSDERKALSRQLADLDREYAGLKKGLAKDPEVAASRRNSEALKSRLAGIEGERAEATREYRARLDARLAATDPEIKEIIERQGKPVVRKPAAVPLPK